jgi:hypothetical protein
LACSFGSDNSGLFVRIVRRLDLDLLGLFVRIWLVFQRLELELLGLFVQIWLVCSDRLETRVKSSWLVRLDRIILACSFGSFGDSS